MAGQRGFDRDLRGFIVPDLADHDDVRIRPQKAAHRCGKGQADLRIDLHLAQAGLRDLDRILGRPELSGIDVDLGQHRVQCGRFARAGRAGRQDQAVGSARHARHRPDVAFVQPDLAQRHRLLRFKQAQHHVFQSVGGGQHRDAQFQLAAAELAELNLAVLRAAALGNVQAGHHLDPGHQRAAQFGRQLQVSLQLALAAHAHPHRSVAHVGLDVDVGGAGLARVLDHDANQPHDAGRIACGGGLLETRARIDLDQGLGHHVFQGRFRLCRSGRRRTVSRARRSAGGQRHAGPLRRSRALFSEPGLD